MTDVFFRNLGGDRYESTEHTQGAWNPNEQHLAAATGLLAHVLERIPGGEGKALSRISLDVLGMIPRGECEITSAVVRPGRRVELLEAQWHAGGRTSIIARAWRLARADTAGVAGTEDARLVPPESVEPSRHMDAWGGGFVRSLEYRPLPGRRAGSGAFWVRTGVELLEGVTASPLARLLGMVDVANGLAPRISPGDGAWSYPNVDLQLHLHRQPAGEWLGLEVRQQYGPEGVGLTSSVLHDADGPFGRAEQILLVRPGGH
ncbi:thioesterase [Pseudoclavibacter endophyticus]|uniref:Thioesterase family protein n=1 Tax=Pseudoclavibacter endophyticus TaxID=1778590 RepID=A0A6H9WI95_9MICO|nr:thioesterase family protein [Pseudoclavibacter endophyticus]KAB1648207.1 thioesterase family protein [Pseudoclavibacter endophyticus]GGA70610.1 thioesterase [Pseudoclavibacter endophyticus]